MLGIALVPETRALFATMSVEDNLLLGALPPGAPRQQGQRRGARTRSTRSSRACRSGARSSPARSRAASARCSRSAAR